MSIIILLTLEYIYYYYIYMIIIQDLKIPEYVSYSAMSTYLTCGYQYYLSRILDLEERPSVWSIGGSAFHLAAERWDRDGV